MPSFLHVQRAQCRCVFPSYTTGFHAAAIGLRLALVFLLLPEATVQAGLGLAENLITETGDPSAYRIFGNGVSVPIFVQDTDYAGVLRAAGDLCQDIERVGGAKPGLAFDREPTGDTILIAGTVGKNSLIDRLVKEGKIDGSKLAGKWESFCIATVDTPIPGVVRAVVVAGSDKRGTIYGLYELSEQLGVSPWYWWADVRPRHRDAAYLIPGSYLSGEPAVRYRGIFLNDEAPCLTGWAQEKFGGLNSTFYTKVFELLLRLRANYLWPAMWDNAFNEDDPENPRLADEYGIVMGTSHHEPMMRAHKEWTKRRSTIGNGEWNYATNAEALRRFFREGIARNKDFDNLITVGMRGDGDAGLASTGTLESDMALLQRVFTDQRRILSQVLQRDASTVPQLWALFTEVQKYYEAGLRPPDDVTLLWTDDNTGNLRRLPTAEERLRKGGAGIYYHFDMHGGPFAYQWINTNPLPKIGEQMNLAYAYGATRIWIVNVGDLKPLELPIEYFLRLAWNPSALTGDKIGQYLERWAERDFGPDHAREIADIVARYTKYNGWRKPELVDPGTYSNLHFGEDERVLTAWRDVVDKAEKIYAMLPAEKRAAFYQLVLHPTKASAVVNEMNIAAGRNHLFAKQGRLSANAMAARVRELFLEDRALSDYYNRELSAGKWNHLMDQTHLGQFSWEPPIVDVSPPVSEVIERASSKLGVSIEGDVNTWPGHFGDAVLPVFDSFQPRRSYIDVFALGTQRIDFSVMAQQPWIEVSEDASQRLDRRFWIDIDWQKAPAGSNTGSIEVKGPQGIVRVNVPVVKASEAQVAGARGRLASLAGPIAFEACAATTRSKVGDASWQLLPDYGRGTGALTIFPVTAPSVLPPAPAPQLEYDLYLPRAGNYEVTLILGPVMDHQPDRGVRIAVAFDDQPPMVLDVFANREAETFLSRGWWTQFTRDNARYLRSRHELSSAGPHELKITMVDPCIVLQKVIVSDRPVPESYFGPPEAVVVR